MVETVNIGNSTPAQQHQAVFINKTIQLGDIAGTIIVILAMNNVPDSYDPEDPNSVLLYVTSGDALSVPDKGICSIVQVVYLDVGPDTILANMIMPGADYLKEVGLDFIHGAQVQIPRNTDLAKTFAPGNKFNITIEFPEPKADTNEASPSIEGKDNYEVTEDIENNSTDTQETSTSSE